MEKESSNFDRIRDIEEENIDKMKKLLSEITTFLNKVEKEYEVKYWGSGGGVDIIIKELEYDEYHQTFIKYNQTISINNNGYVQFERQTTDKEDEEDLK